MVFAGITFLYWFLPVVVLCYFLAPAKWRNGVLLLSSLIFYGWGEPKVLPFLVAAILIGYGFGLGIEQQRKTASKGGKRNARVLLWTAVGIELGFLIYFKYADFFLQNINRLTGARIPLLRVILPVGISFYTFQIISYLVDIYRGSEKAQWNLLDFSMYICLFTQLVAGPIVRYTEIAGQLKKRQTRFEDVRTGVRRLILGLSKKVLLADTIGEFVQIAEGFAEPTVLSLWLRGFAFTLQIYFDFSGYSDMAIGLGRIFGFHFPENFQYPYCAVSITDFWRRWHISLGSWFRDYVYIPLGGNRCSIWKWIRNIVIVWFLTGFWHGAEWNFILWGLMFAIILIFEKALRNRIGGNKVLSHIYVMIIVTISFVIFQESDLPTLGRTLSGMFGFGGLPFASPETYYYLKSFAVTFLLGMIGCTPVGRWLTEQAEKTKCGNAVLTWMEPVVLAVLLLLTTAYLTDSTFHPFLYFRF